MEKEETVDLMSIYPSVFMDILRGKFSAAYRSLREAN